MICGRNNVNGRNAFYLAAVKGHADVIKVLTPLLKNCKDRRHVFDTPVRIAAESGHIEIIKFLAPLAANCENCRHVFTSHARLNQDVVDVMMQYVNAGNAVQ